MAKYIGNSSGKLKEIQPVSTSAGAGDSGKLAQLDSTGRYDISFMPVGVGAEVTIIITSENLSAGDFVNIYSNAGVATGRKADATANTKPAQGFTLTSVTSPANVTIYGPSNKNTALTGMTIGVRQFLGITGGARTETAPSASGNVVQSLGISESTTAMVLSSGDYEYELI